MDPEVIKNLTGSIGKYFKAVADTIAFYIEGQKIDITLSEWAEIRITGPRIKQLNGFDYYQIDVNIMCSAKPTNVYRSQDIATLFASQADPIPIRKQDNSMIGCLALRRDAQHQLDIQQWGSVDVQQTSVMQTSLEAFYEMEIPK